MEDCVLLIHKLPRTVQGAAAAAVREHRGNGHIIEYASAHTAFGGRASSREAGARSAMICDSVHQENNGAGRRRVSVDVW